MAQKFFAPFKNIHGFKKGHDGKKGKLPTELFQYVKCGDIGFPERPSALAHDASLDLIAVGTKEGVIKVLGRPDVEFIASTPQPTAIHAIAFVPHQSRFVTLCGNNELLLWQFTTDDKGVSTLDLSKTLKLPYGSDGDAATCLCLDADHRCLFVGLASGTVSLVKLDSFALAPDEAISTDRVSAGLPKEGQAKLQFGAIAGLALCPLAPRNRLLIGYTKGMALLWQTDRNFVERVMFGEKQELESVTWEADNQHLMACYTDGSYLQWELLDEEEGDGGIELSASDPPVQPYGPFPCKAVTRILRRPSTAPGAPAFVIFAGGMPRASYGDRHTLSVINDAEQVCFDFTSPVVDFLTLDEASGAAHTLLVLLEQELVAIDLKTEGWPLIPPPYLCALHSSSITAVRLCDNIPASLLSQLEEAGSSQRLHPFSTRPWPIQGGRRLNSTSATGQLLLTGHEDGSVSMWAVGTHGVGDGGGMRRLYTLHTSSLFVGDFPPAQEPGQYEHEETWPPFRRTGVFDPFTDDPRLAVKQLELQVLPPRRYDAAPSASLAIGGSAGQLSVWHLKEEPSSVEVDVVKVLADIIPKASQSAMEWRGSEALHIKEGHVDFALGFQPQMVAQLEPPAPITALAHSASLGLLAAGTAHGLAVMDTREARLAYARCTLPESVLAGSGEHSPVVSGGGTGRTGTMASRGLTLKKSLRNSFRRLRKIRSSRRAPAKPPTTPDSGPNSVGDAPDGSLRSPDCASAVSTTGATVDGGEDLDRERASVERSVEARWVPGTSDGCTGVVRCLLFVDTAIVSGPSTTCLLSGGHGGGALLHIVRVNRQGQDSGDANAVAVELRKELQLQHRAPILHMAVVDARPPHLPVGVSSSASSPASASDHVAAPEHELLIVSEEQVKLFSLPHLKPRHKAKMTAMDGNRLKAAAVQRFQADHSHASQHHEEAGNEAAALAALCLLNTAGQCVLMSLPHLKRLAVGEAISPQDVVGVNSGRLLEPCPLGLFQSAPGQLSLFCIATQHGRRFGDVCAIETEAGTRPAEQAGSLAPSNGANGGSGAMEQSNNATPVVTSNSNSTPIAPQQDTSFTSGDPGSLILGGDTTLDSIKDFVAAHPIFDVEKYLRGEEEPVVKRTELVLERKTLVMGGKVLSTTTTEKEVVDGQVIREETRMRNSADAN